MNLPLRWQGIDSLPRANDLVTRVLTASPLSFGLRDLRRDPSAVGAYEDTGFVVRTTDNVGQYCSNRVGEMLVHAGAHLEPGAPVALEVDLLDYYVVEGGTFEGVVQMRTTLRRGTEAIWSQTYSGKSRRWGRTHNPENFNEALSNSLADATRKLLMDDEFAEALGEAPVRAPLVEPSAPPPGAAPPPPGASAGSSGG